MSIKWSGNLTANLTQMDDKVRRGMVAAANYVAPQAESFMKSEAPWTDRTGNARQGLGAKVESSGDRVAIILYHSVDYGVWLEVRWGGKYAIIEPAIAAAMPLFVEAAGRLIFDGA